MCKHILTLVPLCCVGGEQFRCGEFNGLFVLTLILRGYDGEPVASVVFRDVEVFLFVETFSLKA